MLRVLGGGEVCVEVVYANTQKAESKSSVSTRDGRPPLMPKPQIKSLKKDATSDDGHGVPVPQMRRPSEGQHQQQQQQQQHTQQNLYLTLVDRDSDVSNSCDV